VPIDASQHGSPGWWMDLLAKQLAAKQPRFRMLDSYWRGQPPLRTGSKNEQKAFYELQQIARSNLAALIVQSRRDRLSVRAIRTAVDFDETGDETAWDLFLDNNLEVAIPQLAGYIGTFSEGYLANAMDGDRQIITAEDPREMITIEDATGRTVAAFKLTHDFLVNRDYAYLWLPGGYKYVGYRDRKASTPRTLFGGPPPPPKITFAPQSFDMLPFRNPDDETQDPEGVYSEQYDFQDVPVEPAREPDGFGLFEKHIGLLDRINHTILQRVVIATMQAFKQRGLEQTDGQEMPSHDEDGQEIDYNDIFSADPGALWKLPPGVKIWESGQVDLQGILQSAKDDVLHLAAFSSTPLSMFTPDAAAQTAEGAQLQREGLVFSVENFQRILGRALARSVGTAFSMSGDSDRGNAAKIRVEWTPAERYSLAERASADSQAQSLTWEQRQRVIWQQTPDEIRLAAAQRAQDAMQALLAAQPAPKGAPAPVTVSGAGGR